MKILLWGGALMARPFQHHRPLRYCSRRRFASVTGPIYEDDDSNSDNIVITLFTKEGCTLCDTAKDVLSGLRMDLPHSLVAVDITDDDQHTYWNKYKYDIPVLHINGMYWAKHRISEQEAVAALKAIRNGDFTSPPGEPNASKLERT